jgi:uncharacterized protein with PQ loop repeat
MPRNYTEKDEKEVEEHDAWEPFGLVAAILVVVALAPQVYYVHSTGKTQGLSMWWLILVIISQILWVVHGVKTRSMPTILSAIGVSLGYVWMVGLKCKYESECYYDLFPVNRKSSLSKL